MTQTTTKPATAWLFIAHAHRQDEAVAPVYCADRQALIGAIAAAIWGDPKDADEDSVNEVADALIAEGWVHFEGDPSLQVLRVPAIEPDSLAGQLLGMAAHTGLDAVSELLVRAAGALAALNRGARPQTAPSGAPDEATKERVCEAIAEALGDAYDCTRVWNAWSYGTMGPDDFCLVAEDGERVAEIANAAMGAMTDQAQPSVQAPTAAKFSARDDAMRLRALASGKSYNDHQEAVPKHILHEVAMRLETGGYVAPQQIAGQALEAA